MEIENNTFIKHDDIFKLINKIQRTSGKRIWGGVILCLVLSLASLGLYFAKLLELYFTFIFLGLGVLIVIANIMLQYANKRNNSNVKGDLTYKFLFGDESFNVETDLGDQHSNSQISYSSLFKVKEDDNYIYMFINARNTYFVDKKGFNNKEDLDFVKNKLKDYNLYK